MVSAAVKKMAAALEMPSGKAAPLLYDLLSELVNVQNEHRPYKWGAIRIIHSSETLLAEYAVRCLLNPSESAYWGYQVARHYAERYDSHFGTGLIPVSAPLVDDIVEFWRG